MTGGAGFIGANFVLDWLATEGSPVVNLDKLTYAGNLENLASLKADKRHVFVKGDINDRALVGKLLREHRPRAIVHFAAESHVDRSIQNPDAFIHTNVMGTYALLEEARAYWSALTPPERDAFRYLHISTDEVYGSLDLTAPEFTETTAYAPNSPYAASKAAADHLVRAYHHTYGLPTLTTNCSNNYGPFQNPEKFIPLMILNGLREKPMPIYGDGSNIRDWLHVGDHCAAVRRVLAKGRPGETYNIGSRSEMENVDVVKAICALLDEAHPKRAPHEKLVQFVKDRPGHDRRYAMDPHKIERELGWKPAHSFAAGLRKTFEWYLDNTKWADSVMSGEYKRWVDANYAKRGQA